MRNLVKFRYFTFCLFVLLAFISSLSAQFTDINAGLANVTSCDIAWGDYDNDSDLDALVTGSSRNGYITRIYRNDGSDNFIDSNLIFPGTEAGTGSWFDYDNDNNLDILLTGYGASGRISRVYRNIDGVSFSDINAGLIGVEHGSACCGDYDADGDSDILLCGDTGNGFVTSIYRNDNAGVFTEVNVDLIEVRQSSATWGDYDNDGDLDILLTGYVDGNVGTSKVYRNDGNSIFTDTNSSLIGVGESSGSFGDYDNDGDLDILLSGYASGECVSKIFRNDNGLFTDANVGIIGIERGSGCWGDYDNDGDLDVLISGEGSTTNSVTRIYRNDSNSTFTDIAAGLIGVWAGCAVWGDYDNDGDLDIVVSGSIGDYQNSITKVYRNDLEISNIAPVTPIVSHRIMGGLVIEPISDYDNTTPIQAISYNLRLGMTSGSMDILTPLANSNGYRKIPSYGNCFKRKVLDLSPNSVFDIFVSAQAVDNSFTGSSFCDEIHINLTTSPLNIIYPNGNESLVSGITSYIKWANNSVRMLNLQLTTDNGENWTNLAVQPVPSAPGFYYYTIPSTNSSQCLMKIAWAKDESYYDISDQPFTITTSTSAPRITVSTPSATGIYLTPGMPYNITWTSQNLSSVSIDYTIDNGLHWNTIIENRPATPASYNWTVPDSVSNLCRVRIRKADDAGCYDISDNPFTICKVRILNPNGGESLTGDFSGQAKQTITWSAPYVTNLNLYYSTNNGSNWTSITTVSGSAGSYLWSLPALESTQCRIKASHANASYISDMSDAVFTIKVPVKFINCNGGGFVNNNSNYRMRWKNIAVDLAKQVFLEYSIDNSNWIRINSTSVAVTNIQHTFFMALGSATQVWFRMLESDTSRIIAKSATSMTVTEKQLHLTAPLTGESLGIDAYTTISWTSDGCSNLNISYTTDFGASWIPIATNIPSSQMNYVWHVPNTSSSQCRIKLQDTTYAYMNIESDGEFSIIPNNFIASFYATPTTGYSDLVVQFTDQSIGYITSWEWDFENDGITDSNLQNPVWTYWQSGFHTVKLTISDGTTNMSITRNNYIYVLPMVADFLVTETSGYVPLTVQFSDQTQSDVNIWNWDFESNGSIDADYQNPFWTYLFPGTYTVTQTVSNGLDSDTEIKTNYITATLNPAITHYVPTDYLTIQAAINASNDGDYIIVADGIYYENLVIEGKNITLASYYFVDGDSTHIANTIIDGSNALNPDQASTLTILPSNGRPVTAPHIVGFTIRNGIGRRIVQNIGGNTIEKRVGGGVYIRQSDPMFTANKIEDNDADDEGGGSYAFQSIPNFGGVVNAAVGVVNPGNNQFYNNHADLGADIYIYGVTTRDAVKVENCGFEVFSAADTTLSNYWANSSVPLSFVGCSGQTTAITSDIYVSTNGSDTQNTGLTPDSPFKTIDHALSRAFGTLDNPITIHIASGTYSPSLTGEKYPLQMVKYVSLQGAGQDETFLDAEANADYPGRVLNLDRVEGVSISGLSLMGGFVTLAKNYNGGGIGVIESSLSLHHALIANCSSAGDGAGVYAYDSAFSADSLNVAYNSALGSGGGFASVQSELSLSNSTIEENSVNKNGAGISADSGILSIQGCNIANNQATGYQSKGGGLAVSNTANALIRNNQIKHNKADNGAGLYLQGNSELSLDRNQIRNNLADFNGGGLFVNTTTGLITNNLISGNTASQRGGGLYCYSSPQIINNTIACNKANLQGGGLYLNGAAPSISNSILWANQSGSTPNQLYLFGEAADPNISYCDIQAGQGGIITSPGNSYSGTWENNLDTEPQFVELPLGAGYYYDSGDFDLQEGSPCIDTGDPNTGISLFPLDLDGNARIDNNRIDIGAYEHIFYYGPRIAANPQQISFGRLNINGLQQSLGLSLTNTGNQPLQIHSLTWENNPSLFSYEFAGLNQDILPGNSITITLSFLPPAIGSYSNNLIINNNSLNQANLSIPITGTGIDASTSTPGSLSLTVVGDDVQLSWDAVTSDPNGDPYTPDGYIVLYSEKSSTLADDYYFLSFTTNCNYIHQYVAMHRQRMFYQVIAYSGISRETINKLGIVNSTSKPKTYRELKLMLRTRI